MADLQAALGQAGEVSLGDGCAWGGLQPGTKVEKVAPLGQKGLERYDGSLRVTAADVRSGSDTLGSGERHATLDDGVLALRPSSVK